MEIEFTQPNTFDIEQCVSFLNYEDRNELLAIGVEPSWGIQHSVDITPNSMVVRVNSCVACIVGLTLENSLGLEVPRPWLFGTPYLFKDHRTFVRSTRKVLDFWLSEFPEISNYVDTRNLRAIQWLKHFGAEFGEPEPYGPYARPFLKFTFRRS